MNLSHTNRASVSQDELLPLMLACVHKNSDIHFARALLGGSDYDFSLMCIPVSSKHVGKEYMEFFTVLCQHGKIPLALFRISPKDHQEYIYTNPNKHTILRENDQVYVCESHEPEKQNDFSDESIYSPRVSSSMGGMPPSKGITEVEMQSVTGEVNPLSSTQV